MRRFKIVICRGPECGEQRQSAALFDVFTRELARTGARETTEVAWQSCFGRCTQGPNVLVREIASENQPPSLGTGFATLPGPRGVTALYNRVDVTRAPTIVVEHVNAGRVVREFIERPGIHPNEPVASASTPKPKDS